MVVVVDTSSMPLQERIDALNSITSEVLGPSVVSHDMPAEYIHNTTSYWDIGPSNSLIRSRDTNMRIHCSPRDLRMDGRELFAMSFQHRGTSLLFEKDGPRAVPEGTLNLDNWTRPHELGYHGEADCSAFLISHRQMGLPLSIVDRASQRLESSPLYPMVRRHLAALCAAADADQLPAERAAGELASATVQLVRALVTSAVPENPRARDVVIETQFVAVVTYLRQHLRDSSLTPQRVAAANQISVRQLYKLWSTEETSLNDWVLRERLEAARTELATPGLLHLTIEVIARRCAFSDASHFSRRFRQAYGMTPREWRVSQTGAPKRPIARRD
jgi:AraC-like DNA-binding protein